MRDGKNIYKEGDHSDEMRCDEMMFANPGLVG